MTANNWFFQLLILTKNNLNQKIMKQLTFIFTLCFSLSLYAQNNSTSINMNINMNLEGNTNSQPEPNQNSNMNINFNIEDNNNSGNTLPAQSQPVSNAKQPQPKPQVVYVSGYNGKIGCTPPVNSERLEDMAKTVENQTFNDDKVRVTKQIIRTNCITLDQLIVLLNNFDWDDGKLEIAKFAYDYVYDLENYYKVYNLFTFSSSGEELDEYIQDRN